MQLEPTRPGVTRLTFPEAALIVYVLLLFVPLGFWTLRTMQAVGRTRYANS